MADKMRIYDDVKDMVEDEIEKIVKQGELNHDSLMNLGELIDIKKDLCEITSSEEIESGYSQRMYPHMYDMGNSYRMGRYSRNTYNDTANNGGYSRHGSDIADRLGHMMTEATTEREREAIRRALESI